MKDRATIIKEQKSIIKGQKTFTNFNSDYSDVFNDVKEKFNSNIKIAFLKTDRYVPEDEDLDGDGGYMMELFKVKLENGNTVGAVSYGKDDWSNVKVYNTYQEAEEYFITKVSIK